MTQNRDDSEHTTDEPRVVDIQDTKTTSYDRNTIRWDFREALSGVFSSPTVADGTVYVGSGDNTLYAVDAVTGQQAWIFEEPSSFVDSSPTVADGTVYVGSSDGTLYAVDAGTGQQEWDFKEPTDRVLSSPTVADGTVYVGSGDETLYAVEATTGDQKWAFEEPSGSVHSSPTVVNETVYVGSGDNTLYAVDVTTGDQEWTFEEPSDSVHSSPTVADGTVYVGSNDGTLYAVDTATGNERWAFEKPSDRVFSSPTVADDTVYVGSDDGTLYAVDATTGDQEWVFEEPSCWVHSSPTVAGGTIYVGSGDTTLYAVNAATGDQEWAFEEPSRWIHSSPIVVDGTVYVGSNTLYAIDTGTNASSEGSRVNLGTLGHHEDWDSVDVTPMRGAVMNDLGQPLADTDIEIRTEDGQIVRTVMTDRAGRWSTSLSAGRYEVVAMYDSTEKTRTIEHGGEGTVVHHSLSEGEWNILYGPQSPSTASEITFQTSIPGEDPEWDFGDGTTATGPTVSHQYDEPSTYEITVQTAAVTHQTNVKVIDDEIGITNVRHLLRGQMIEGLGLPNAWEVQTISPNTIETVTVEVGGESYEAIEERSDRWVTETTPLDHIGSDQTVTVTATDIDGNTATETTSLTVYSTPDWIQWLLDYAIDIDRMTIPITASNDNAVARSTGKDDVDIHWQPSLAHFYEDFLAEISIVIIDTDIELKKLPAPWECDLCADLQIAISPGIVLPDGTPQMTVKVNSDVYAASTRVKFKLDDPRIVFGSGMTLQQAKIPIKIGGGRIIPTKKKFPYIGEQGFEFYFGAIGDYEFRKKQDTDFNLRKAGFGGEFTGETEFGEKSVNLSINVTGNAIIGMELPSDNSFPTWYLDYQLKLKGELQTGLHYSKSFEWTITKDSYSWPDSDAERADIVQEAAESMPFNDEEWGLQEPRGANPHLAVPSVDERADPRTEIQSKTAIGMGIPIRSELDRLTNRPYEDTEPAITTTDEGHAVVWSTKQEDQLAIEGRDIVVRTHDGSTWSEPTYITDDDRHDETPAIASIGNSPELLTAWTRANVDASEEDISTPQELFPHYEIAFAHFNGETWDELTLVTDSDALHYKPVVAADDDRWLIAWETNSDADPATDENSSVEYLITNGSEELARGILNNAVAPAVGISTDGFELAYYDPASESESESGTLVHGVITDDEFDERERHAVDEYHDHATDGGQLAWIEGTISEPILYHDDGSDPEQVPLTANMSDLDELSLTVEGKDVLLTYRGRPEQQDRPDIVYRVARAGEWTTDRRLAGGPDNSLTLWYTDAVLDDDHTFTLVYAAKEFGMDKRNDIFVTTQEFGPDYTLEADAPDGVPPGELVNINYTIRNVGEQAEDDDIRIVLSNDDGEVKAQTHDPLAPNETVSGTFDVPANEQGQYTVSVALESDPVEEWLSVTESVTTGTPNLRISDVDTNRTAANETEGTVAITLANDGTAIAESVPVTVDDGTGPVVNLTADTVPAGEAVTVTTTVDTDALNHSRPDAITIDPDNELEETAIGNRTHRTHLFTADLAVHGPPRYVESDNEVVATLEVSNRGDIGTTASMWRSPT